MNESEQGNFRALEKIVSAAQWGCSAVLVCMLATVLANITARSVFNVSLGFGDEYAAYALVALSFLGAPIAYRRKRKMMQVRLLFDRLPSGTRLGLDVVWHAVGMAFSLVLFLYLWRHWLSTFEKGAISTTSTQTPLWVPQALMPMGSALLCVVVAACLVESVMQLRKRGR